MRNQPRNLSKWSKKEHQELRSRQDKLRSQLSALSSESYVNPVLKDDISSSRHPRIVIACTVRVRKTDYVFEIWEDFRIDDMRSALYGFKYCLRGSNDPDVEPLFRYECHPDTQDSLSSTEIAVSKLKQSSPEYSDSPYGLVPHYHPHPMDHPITRLHYPFQFDKVRSMEDIIFELIQWLDVDLVKRFYDSGRVPSAKR